MGRFSDRLAEERRRSFSERLATEQAGSQDPDTPGAPAWASNIKGKYEPQLGKQPPPARVPTMGLGEALGLRATQGATFGFAPKAQGMIQAIGNKVTGYHDDNPNPPSFAEDYEREKKLAFRDMDDAEQVSGKLGTAVELLSAAPTALVGPAANIGRGLGAVVGGGAITGGVTGAAMGVANSRRDPMLEGDEAELDVLDSAAGGALFGAGGALGGRGLSKLFERFTSAGRMNAALRELAQHENVPNPNIARAQEVVGEGNPVPLTAVENPANRLTLKTMFEKPKVAANSLRGQTLVDDAVSGADTANRVARESADAADLAALAEKGAYQESLINSRNAQRGVVRDTAVANAETSATTRAQNTEAKNTFAKERHSRAERSVERKNQFLTDQEERALAIEEARVRRNAEIRSLRESDPDLDVALEKGKAKELPNILDKHLGTDSPKRLDLDTAFENLKQAREPIPKPRFEKPVAPPMKQATPAKQVPPAYKEPDAKALQAARQDAKVAKQKVKTTAEETEKVYAVAKDLEKAMNRIHGAKRGITEIANPLTALKVVTGKQWLDRRAVKKILSDPKTYDQFMDLAAKGKRLPPDPSHATRWGAEMAAFIESLQE